MKLSKMRNEISFSQRFALAISVPLETPPIEFAIGDKVGVDNGGEPEGWSTGVIVGLHLRVYVHETHVWEYCVHFDSPIGTQVWFGEDDSTAIHHAENIPDFQKLWEQENLQDLGLR